MTVVGPRAGENRVGGTSGELRAGPDRSRPSETPPSGPGGESRRLPRLRRHRRSAVAVALLLVGAGGVLVGRSLLTSPTYSSICVYPRESITTLGQVDALTGHVYSCVMAYDNANPTWATWEVPWFATTKITDRNWADWVRERSGRRLVITISLVPSDVPPNWRQICASGGYDSYAAALGRNLVNEGLSRSVLRISPEANDPGSGVAWNGGTPEDMSAWAKCWAQEARAMEVPGSHFLFDWTVNAGYEDIPFSDYYPGNSAVDIIGIDAYDSLVSGQQVPPGRERWRLLSREPGGIEQLVQFAKAHGKALSVPEWGEVAPPAGGGDDPYYMKQMARLFKKDHVVYESYFDEDEGGTLRLGEIPQSLRVYQEMVLRG